MKASSSRRGLVAALVILIGGLTIGYACLAVVYTGPLWVKLLVGAIYISVLIPLIVTAQPILKAMVEGEKKSEGRIAKS